MKKAFALIAAGAMVCTLASAVSAANATLTQPNEITIYAPVDGEEGGKIQLAVTGTVALESVSSDKAIAAASDDKTSVGIIYMNAVTAGTAVAKLTFTGSGNVTITGVDGDFSGALGTIAITAATPGTSGVTPGGQDLVPSGTSGPTGQPAGTGNPNTGIIFAIIPAAAAAGAVIVSKKKK